MNDGLTHIVRPAHISEKDFKGELKYRTLAAGTDELAGFYLFEDFLEGFVANSSFGGTPECKKAMGGMIYYAFEMLKNRAVYNPSKSVKLVIAFQSYQQQQALFYT